MRWIVLGVILMGVLVVTGCGGSASQDDLQLLEERVDELERRLDEVEAAAASDRAELLELLGSILADIPIGEELRSRLGEAADLVETACGSAVDRLGEIVGGPIQEACEAALDSLRDGGQE